MKKLFALILAVALVLSMATTAMAADTVSLSINHIAGGHTYKAYQIFDGNLTDSGILSDIVWGPGVDAEGLLAALKADETKIYNSMGTEFVQFSTLFANATDAEGVVEVLEKFSTDGDRLEHFAKIAAEYVIADQGVASDNGAAQNDGSYKYTITNLDPGYYIVLDETAAGNVGSKDYKTRYIVALTTHTNLNTKGDYTVVVKSVSETLDGSYTEHIANQLYKPHFFELAANIDNDISEYDAYYLKFNDTMSKGFEFLGLTEVYVLKVNNEKDYLYRNGAWAEGTTPDTYSVTTDDTGKTVMIIEWQNILGAYANLAGDDTLVVHYSAQLTENAVVGSANPNEVTIEFTNGPDVDDHGTSVPDYAYVFPFGMRLNKVDADDNTILLPGAKFVLYHFHGTEKHYVGKVGAEGEILSWTPYLNEAALNAAVEAEEDAEKKAAITAQGYAHEFVTDANGNFIADGLDEGTIYYLSEIAAPAGYNKMFTDIKFSIQPTYGTNSNGVPIVESITYLVDGNSTTITAGDDFAAGRIVVTALNDKGNTLPSTGGIGTTIFYILGTVLVVGAAVILVTKKRMTMEA